jgi:hypothetical protein
VSDVAAAAAPASRGGSGWVASHRFERSLAIIVAVFAALFVLQAVDALLADWSWFVLGQGTPAAGSEGPLPPSLTGAPPQELLPSSGVSSFGVVSLVLMGASLALGFAATLRGRQVRAMCTAAAGVFAVALAVALPTIPLASPGSTVPWLIAVAPVLAAYLAVGYRNPLVAVAAAVGVAAALALAFLLLASFPLAVVLPDALFDAALGVVLAVLIALVRHSVWQADVAQRSTLHRYQRSQLDDATEAERVRTDALVHDTVLTTLLQASSGVTPDDEALAGRMADNALRVIAHLRRSAQLGDAVALRSALEAATAELDPLLPAFEVESGAMEDLVLPAEAADALVGAMIELLRHSVARGGSGIRRTLHLLPLGPDGIRITVADDGEDAEDAGPRLSPSATERLEHVHARLEVRTAPGAGTALTVSWGSIVIAGVNPSSTAGRGVPA